jgi:transposase
MCELTFVFLISDLVRNSALAPVGQRIIVHNAQPLSGERYSVTVLTSVDPNAPHPISLDIRQDSNSAEDFVALVAQYVAAGYLVRGDILLCDNASIHIAEQIWDQLRAVLDQAGVILRLLPAYSPELNPCELVFSQMKSFLRHERISEDLLASIIRSASKVSYVHMLKYYKHCLSM